MEVNLNVLFYNIYFFFTYSFDYLIKLADDRTVPIELGSRYSDDDWTQKLMTITDFVKQYCLQRVCSSTKDTLDD